VVPVRRIRSTHSPDVPRVEGLRVQNYRCLRGLELKQIHPFTTLLGPNGSGKSTLFDVFAFLSESFTGGLRKAWDKRGRFKELRSRGASGPISFELKCRESPGSPLITYHLGIQEDDRGPFVESEWLQWKRRSYGCPFRFLEYHQGRGWAVTGEQPDETAERREEQLTSREILAVNSLGQFQSHPRISALRGFITDWYLSYLTADSTRTTPEAGPQERLAANGSNLPNVIQYLKEQHPGTFSRIIRILQSRVPRLADVDARILEDGRLLLQLRDAPFDQPVLAKFASDGTLKMLSYLVLFNDPEPPQLVGVEEPENHLHPRLLPHLTEECQTATARIQLLVTTHSPFFVSGVTPKELWILYRDSSGYTKAECVGEIEEVTAHMQEGASLGDLWLEGFFGVGDPLRDAVLT
jgi:predicted ATPase